MCMRPICIESSFVDADVQDRYSEALLSVLIDNVHDATFYDA